MIQRFLAGLVLVLATLKLLGHTDLSWWWITAPIWGSLLLAVSLFVVGWFGFDLLAADGPRKVRR